MIDHLKPPATDPARSRAFYEHAPAPLGYRVLIRRPASIGLGPEPATTDRAMGPARPRQSRRTFTAAGEEEVRAGFVPLTVTDALTGTKIAATAVEPLPSRAAVAVRRRYRDTPSRHANAARP